mgnify:CR=1 FL=1|jgi:hypothetical protein|tara:strand:- start:608 stop:817 length:210 start_codon:yes stop_codon:yes gene_type:complete
MKHTEMDLVEIEIHYYDENEILVTTNFLVPEVLALYVEGLKEDLVDAETSAEYWSNMFTASFDYGIHRN